MAPRPAPEMPDLQSAMMFFGLISRSFEQRLEREDDPGWKAAGLGAEVGLFQLGAVNFAQAVNRFAQKRGVAVLRVMALVDCGLAEAEVRAHVDHAHLARKQLRGRHLALGMRQSQESHFRGLGYFVVVLDIDPQVDDVAEGPEHLPVDHPLVGPAGDHGQLRGRVARQDPYQFLSCITGCAYDCGFDHGYYFSLKNWEGNRICICNLLTFFKGHL